MKRIVILCAMFLAVSCSKDMNNVDVMKLSVGVNVSLKQVKENTIKQGSYKRGTAPVYIAGLDITAKSLDFPGKITSGTFYFKSENPDEGDDIVLEGVAVGSNEFTAKCICNSAPENVHILGLNSIVGTDLNDVANKYAERLRELKPIYANYKEEYPIIGAVSVGGDNNVSIRMIASSHRLGVVLENSLDSDCSLVWRIFRESSLLFDSNSRALQPGDIEAFIVNDINAVSYKKYTVEVIYYINGSSAPNVVKESVSLGSGENTTMYLKFKKKNIIEGGSELKLRYVPIKE